MLQWFPRQICSRFPYFHCFTGCGPICNGRGGRVQRAGDPPGLLQEQGERHQASPTLVSVTCNNLFFLTFSRRIPRVLLSVLVVLIFLLFPSSMGLYGFHVYYMALRGSVFPRLYLLSHLLVKMCLRYLSSEKVAGDLKLYIAQLFQLLLFLSSMVLLGPSIVKQR